MVEQTGVVERWWGEGLAEAEVIEQALTSPLLSGFSVDVRALPR